MSAGTPASQADLDQPALRPTWLFGSTVHEGCDRAGYYEQGDFTAEYGSAKCLVKLGCWGPVVKCNVPKRGHRGEHAVRHGDQDLARLHRADGRRGAQVAHEGRRAAQRLSEELVS